MVEEKVMVKPHKVLMSNRKTASFSGVLDVISFDLKEILLETEEGMLTIRGNDLHVNRLSVEKGEVEIEGGIGLGMTAYYFLLSRWFIAASVFILRGIAKLLCPFGRYIRNKTGKTVRIMKKELQNGARTIKMGLCKL